ncbi:chemotaxis protein CheC [Candidatus Woesearchaeota archaeon]|nr:chemotaxis protein CheC [Candidatus Woesearchaeota archaeon]
MDAKTEVGVKKASETVLGEFELDSLKEMANIGTGNASIALSSLLNTKVKIDVPTTEVVSVHDVKNYFTRTDELAVGIYSNIKEGMTGNLVLLFPLPSALVLLDQLGRENAKKNTLSKQDLDILKKLGSVLYSIYLTSIAKFLSLKIIFQPPNIVSTLESSIIDFVLVDIDQEEKCILIRIGFQMEGTGVTGNFILLFTLSSLTPMINRLKQEMEAG